MNDQTQARGEAHASARRRPPGLLLFLPSSLARGAFLSWLKRIHAWTGIWGALLFLLLATSGLLLNHRNVLKLNTGAPREVSSVVLEVEPGALATKEDLGRWAQVQFDTQAEPRPPREEGPAPDRRASFMGQDVVQAEVWKLQLSGPNGAILVEYVPGDRSVKAIRTEQNLFGLIKNLHKGAGLGVAWVLFIDTIAGALIAMSLTGLLLWSRLHGPRLAAIAILLASIAAAGFASLPAFI